MQHRGIAKSIERAENERQFDAMACPERVRGSVVELEDPRTAPLCSCVLCPLARRCAKDLIADAPTGFVHRRVGEGLHLVSRIADEDIGAACGGLQLGLHVLRENFPIADQSEEAAMVAFRKQGLDNLWSLLRAQECFPR
ncbi:hypothetical protein SAMN03159371_00831 [Variovorax sp. NFACC28]|nr:hypothetical protein SAMN03159371_00831 [Variovorax sp. NFACC28]SEG09601.1 hypothetical protein SAMN03159365_01410 [Variovorax sp. NFACC29]SFC03946.1 hypothetical protein SAMN03159379_01409 [Variovorax sp. NFACC26]SFF77503.1 hypothetical protein SAMN03159447_00014 [Variovorax sp. NFACC27]